MPKGAGTLATSSFLSSTGTRQLASPKQPVGNIWSTAQPLGNVTACFVACPEGLSLVCSLGWGGMVGMTAARVDTEHCEHARGTIPAAACISRPQRLTHRQNPAPVMGSEPQPRAGLCTRRGNSPQQPGLLPGAEDLSRRPAAHVSCHTRSHFPSTNSRANKPAAASSSPELPLPSTAQGNLSPARPPPRCQVCDTHPQPFPRAAVKRKLCKEETPRLRHGDWVESNRRGSGSVTAFSPLTRGAPCVGSSGVGALHTVTLNSATF